MKFEKHHLMNLNKTDTQWNHSHNYYGDYGEIK